MSHRQQAEESEPRDFRFLQQPSWLPDSFRIETLKHSAYKKPSFRSQHKDNDDNDNDDDEQGDEEE